MPDVRLPPKLANVEEVHGDVLGPSVSWRGRKAGRVGLSTHGCATDSDTPPRLGLCLSTWHLCAVTLCRLRTRPWEEKASHSQFPSQGTITNKHVALNCSGLKP